MNLDLIVALLQLLLFASVSAFQNGYDTPHNGIVTSSGILIGNTASNKTDVIEFLGVSYAASTSGVRRWLPPLRFTSNATFNVSNYGPYVTFDHSSETFRQAHSTNRSCPANLGGTVAFPNKTAQFDRIFLAFTTQGGNVQSEDCLSLNIWVKKTSKQDSSKPVLVFFPGGRWNAGGSKSTFYNGQYLADAEDIIVVTINYRLNIFGFPGAPDIPQNAGLLDQRMALEWLRDNIPAFGGDPGRITVFGQSAGSVSVGYLAYAYPEDPIVAGYIMESGTPHSWTPLTPDLAAQHWYNVSSLLGCGTTGNVLGCMQSKNMSEVLAAFAKLPFDPTDALNQPQFQPVVNNITVFQNYSALAAAGRFAKLPLLIGNTNFESGFYQIAAFATSKPFNATQQALFNLEAFTCATAIESASRSDNGATVYRYRYFGDFDNLRLFPNSGAYHGSELEMIFGTAEDVSGLPNTESENSFSRYMMKVWAAFARDPETGLSQLGWPKYGASKEATLVRLRYGDEFEASFVAPSTSDAECPVLGGAVNLGKGAM